MRAGRGNLQRPFYMFLTLDIYTQNGHPVRPALQLLSRKRDGRRHGTVLDDHEERVALLQTGLGVGTGDQAILPPDQENGHVMTRQVR